MTTFLIFLPFFSVAGAITLGRWAHRRQLAREANLLNTLAPAVRAPLYTTGGQLPDFFHGQRWPTNSTDGVSK